MVFKKLLTSVCLSSMLCTSILSVPNRALAVEHITNDTPQESLLYQDVWQMIAALAMAIATMVEAINLNGSIGALEQKANISGVLSDVVKDNAVNFVASTVPEGLEDLDFKGAMEKAEKMQALIKTELLPPVEVEQVLTDDELQKRIEKRLKIQAAAVGDAYAAAVAYLSESTKAENEKIKPILNSISAKKTLKDKYDGANEVAIARVKEQIDNNRLTAELLKMSAANILGNMPRTYEK